MGEGFFSDTVRLGVGSLPTTISTVGRSSDGRSTNTSISLQWSGLPSETLPIKRYIAYMSTDLVYY
jgi:hypothetical protein